jgi:hypothetical protein
LELDRAYGSAVISMRYRVDTVPWPIRPLYLTVTWALGLFFYIYYLICRLTSEISIEGPGNYDLSQHAIFCLWHEGWWSYFVVFLRYPSPHVAINHPAAYMKPIHVVFRLMGRRRLLLVRFIGRGRAARCESSRGPC